MQLIKIFSIFVFCFLTLVGAPESFAYETDVHANVRESLQAEFDANPECAGYTKHELLQENAKSTGETEFVSSRCSLELACKGKVTKLFGDQMFCIHNDILFTSECGYGEKRCATFLKTIDDANSKYNCDIHVGTRNVGEKTEYYVSMSSKCQVMRKLDESCPAPMNARTVNDDKLKVCIPPDNTGADKSATINPAAGKAPAPVDNSGVNRGQ